MDLTPMETKLISFEEKLAYGKDWEDRFARWLIKKEWYVTPKYLFSEEGAPLLIGDKNKYSIPDIDAAKSGKRIWFECKRKKMMLKHFATGYASINHEHYKKVQEITGDKVFVIFEDDANRYDGQRHYGNYINELEKHIYGDDWFFNGKKHILFSYPKAFVKVEC
mgnify:FL=1